VPGSPEGDGSDVIFKAVKAGQVVTLNVLSFTGSMDLLADQVAHAFENLSDLSPTGPMTSIGSYTGVLDGTTGAVSTVAGEGAKLLSVAPVFAPDPTATPGIAGCVMHRVRKGCDRQYRRCGQ